MLKSKFLPLLVIPAFIVGIIAYSALGTHNPIEVQRLQAKAHSEPNILPQPIAYVEQPQAEAVNPEIKSEPEVPKKTVSPAPASTAKPATKRPAAAPAPKINISTSTTTTQAAPSCLGNFTQEFICLLNKYRVSQGKGKLSSNTSLATVALSHSAWMDSTGTFSHTGINGSRLADRCASYGTVCQAENLALDAISPQNLLDMWTNSPGHNANLLGSYAIIGLGISGNYITALFN